MRREAKSVRQARRKRVKINGGVAAQTVPQVKHIQDWFAIPPTVVPTNQIGRVAWSHSLAFNPGSPYVANHWHTNSIVNPYATGGSQPIVVGTTSKNALFDYYRVLDYTLEIHCMNLGTNVVRIYVAHTNQDVSAISSSLMEALSMEGDSGFFLMGPAGSVDQKWIYRRKMRNAMIVGREAYFTDDNYGGVIGASLTPGAPADTCHFTVAMAAVSGNVNVYVSCRVIQGTEFTNKELQTS